MVPAKVHILVDLVCPSCPPCVHSESIVFVQPSPLLRVTTGDIGQMLSAKCYLHDGNTVVTWSFQMILGRQQDIAGKTIRRAAFIKSSCSHCVTLCDTKIVSR